MIGDKKYFLIIAIVLILMTIGGVCASDNSTVDSVAAGDSGSVDVDESPVLASDASVKENITVENNDEPASAADSESGEVLGASNDEDVLGATDLPNAISSSNINSYKSWTTDYQTTRNAGTSVSVTNAIIDGNGRSVSGQGQYRIFEVTGAGNTFQNIVFINGKTTSIDESKVGGAVLVEADTTFKNCIFRNNRQENSYGGAICLKGNYKLTIINCTFEDNFAGYNGGAIYAYAGSVKINITDSRFNHNLVGTTSSFAPALMANGQSNAQSYLYLDNCNFTNHVSGKGHSVMQVQNFANNNLRFSNCLFEGNEKRN